MKNAITILLALGFAAGAMSSADAQDEAGFNAGAAQVPPKGTYDHYNGPSATVLKKGVEAQHEPGVTSEISPSAKQTATGGPSGGVPGNSGGR